MPWNIIFNIIGAVGGIFGIVGGACGVASLVYARRQTKLMEDDKSKRERGETEDSEWAERHERLASQLLRINPNLRIAPPGVPEMVLYASIFCDGKLREALQTYIVDLHPSGTQFVRRAAPRPDELRRAVVRETIRKAERCMAEFQRQNPKIDLKYYMGFEVPRDV